MLVGIDRLRRAGHRVQRRPTHRAHASTGHQGRVLLKCPRIGSAASHGFSLRRSSNCSERILSTPCAFYQKAVTCGESFTFKKWVVLAVSISQAKISSRRTHAARGRGAEGRHDPSDAKLNAQDILVNRPGTMWCSFPRQPRDKTKRDPARPGDTYNDHFQVIEHEGMLTPSGRKPRARRILTNTSHFRRARTRVRA